MDGIKSAIEHLNRAKVTPVRKRKFFSFGSIEECKQLFLDAFISIDETITEVKWLPEYNKVIQWMHNNEGKGLCLRGDCGRGKTNILTGVLPVIFMLKFNKIMKADQAEDIPINLMTILKRQLISLDEIGTEPLCNDFGEKFEGFNRIINLAEREIRLLFITTNLEKDEILDRYGVRTWERINRLCLVIKFEGDSLR